MSDAIRIAKEAPKHIEGLLADMFAANADDNRVCLGGIYAGQQYIQIQLVVNSNQATLMDEGYLDDDFIRDAKASRHSPLTTHWLTARAEFIGRREAPLMRTEELLALGAIRSIYWLALGQGDAVLAREIGDWWRDCASLHELDEVIR